MTAAVRKITAAELWDMPEHRDCELIRGELRKMPPGGFDHGVRTSRLQGPLSLFVRQHGLGEVCGAETGFVISSDPDTMRAPDVAFVSTQRIKQYGMTKTYFPAAPDLAVEVVSPNDTLYEVEEKVNDWLAGGARLVWVVNPKARAVTAYTSDRSAQILKQEDTLTGGDVIPGFTLPIAEIFS